jgi:hypothetical protein
MSNTTRTERYIRNKGQWVKITRDSKARTFSFARGYDGNFQAVTVQTWPMSAIPTWVDAEYFAQRAIDTYA